MKSSGLITREEVLHWFDYEPDTGIFRWKRRPAIGGMNAKVGDQAGSIIHTKPPQRRMLHLQGRRLFESRAAYMYVHGDIPENAVIDHAGGDTLNNRIDNLRLASDVQNTWNRLRGDGRLAHGVAKDRRGRFKARIQAVDGKKINLGTWATEAEARAAYMGAAAVMHGEFWIGNRTSEKARKAALLPTEDEE